MLDWWVSWKSPPWQDLAREELLLQAAAQGHMGLFTYAWARPALVLGYGQDPASGIDLEACRALEIPVLRRLTGGTGVLYTGDLALALALPASHVWCRSIASLYEAFTGALQEALAWAGVDAQRPAITSGGQGPRSPICFETERGETLLIGGKKALGCAQVRRKEAALVHGALLLGVNAGLQARVYGVPRTRIEQALGAVPQGLERSARDWAALAARAMSDALGESPPSARPAPPLPPEWSERGRDPKWVIIGTDIANKSKDYAR